MEKIKAITTQFLSETNEYRSLLLLYFLIVVGKKIPDSRRRGHDA
jgi:hypothetical protein